MNRSSSSLNAAEGAYLNTIATVHLGLTLVIFPDHTKLDDSLRDLNDSEGFVVGWVLFEERTQAGSQLVQCLYIYVNTDNMACSIRARTCSNSGSEAATMV